MRLFLTKSLLGLLVLGTAIVFSPVAAQEVKTAKGQISMGIHKYQATAGELYVVQVTGEGFHPNVSQHPEYLRHLPRDSGKDFIFKGYAVSRDMQEQTVYISVQHGGLKGTGPFSYALEVKKVPFAEKPLLAEKGSWEDKDPVYKKAQKDTHYKAFNITLKANQFYMIELKRLKDNIEPYLYLEDSKGNVIHSHDGGGQDAQLIFWSTRVGEHRIIATTYEKVTGPFALSVKTQKVEKE